MIVLSRLENFFKRIVNYILGLSMFLLMLIVFIQVLARFCHVSIGGLEELPVYLMAASVWFAGSALCSTNGHISLDILPMVIHNKKAQAALAAITNLVSVGALCYLCYVMTQYMFDQRLDGTISAGLKFPMWWFTLVIVFNVIVMAVFTLKNAIKELEMIKDGNTN